MICHPVSIAGLDLLCDHPLFLLALAVHIPFGLLSVATGVVAMLSPKVRGRHSTSGALYFWGLLVVFVSASVLAWVRWVENAYLFGLGALAFSVAFAGRTALRQRWSDGIRIHIAGMGVSYIMMLTAFYVDNGPHLVLWRRLPPIVFWVLPAAVGLPFVIRAWLRHPT